MNPRGNLAPTFGPTRSAVGRLVGLALPFGALLALTGCSDLCGPFKIKVYVDRSGVVPRYTYEFTPKIARPGFEPFRETLDGQPDGDPPSDVDIEELCEKIFFGDSSRDNAPRENNGQQPDFPRLDEFSTDGLSADLNGDTRSDLALVIEDKNEVAILLGGGAAPLRFPTGAGPQAIAAARIDAGATLDLVTANEGDVSLLLGVGDGTFASGVSLGAFSRARDVEIGDFNGDGNADLVVAMLNDPAVLLLGNGDGTFQPRQNLAAGVASQVQMLDLNPAADDHDDIVTDGTILLGNGDGTFAAPVVFSEAPADQLYIEDLDGDDDPDIILVSKATLLASLFRGNGDGTVTPLGHLVTDNFPEALLSIDLDFDGLLDLWISSTQAPPARYLARGDGTFEGPAAYPSVTNLANGLGAGGVAVADFTGDGLPDAVVANTGNVQCTVSNPCFGGQPAVLFPGIGGGRLGAPVTLPQQPGHAVITGDWNGDSVPDLAFAGVGVASPQLYILLGVGDGAFLTGPAYDLPGTRQAGSNASLIRARLDAGPTDDIVVATPGSTSVLVFTGSGTGDFIAVTPLAAGTGIKTLAAADLDADGDADLVIASAGATLGAREGLLQVALNNGDATFAPPQTLRSNVAANGLALADFNGDGHIDLAASMEVAAFDWDVEVFPGNGDGTFGTALALGMDEGLSGGIVAMDADGDGVPDLAVRAGNNSVIGFRSLCDGTFARALTGSTGGGRVLLAADLDLDGRDDLLTATGKGFFSVQMNRLESYGFARPKLDIRKDGDAIEIVWPAAFADHELTESETLLDWAPANRPIEAFGDLLEVTVDPPAGARFFRLEKENP